MPRALVLLTNGNYKVVVLRDVGDYQQTVGGFVQLLPTRDNRISCYVNEEGALKMMPINPWSPFLIQIGVRMLKEASIVGNIIVLGGVNDDDYDDTDVPDDTVEFARQHANEEIL